MHFMLTGQNAFPHADIDLARRLEGTEGAANAAFVAARAAMDPLSGATHVEIAGVYASYDGPESPLTQTFGLGIFEPAGAPELKELESFFEVRGASVHHEVSPFVSQQLLSLLTGRDYRPVEMSSVLIRPTLLNDSGASHLRVREMGDDERGIWARTAGEGWSSESPELAAFVESFGQVITRADGVHCFIAELEGRPVAAAAMTLHGSVALLAGASTVPDARRQGAQRALLEHRLRHATDRGADLAMIVTAPGSGSQRNAERQGFRVAYTRTKWKLFGSGA
jgi:GNAT superfamily N-acetyltransferase